MIIRKKFNFFGQHIVRNCSSERCKKSIHSHEYEVELFFTSKGLDKAAMVMDFGLMKGTIKEFIKSFDNSFSIWRDEDKDFIDTITKKYDRVVIMPVSPSAESYSLMFFYVVDKILKATEFNNGEKDVALQSVRVHETRTGYAESFREDLEYWDFKLKDIKFSNAIVESWSDSEFYNKLKKFNPSMNSEKPFVNPIPEIQVEPKG